MSSKPQPPDFRAIRSWHGSQNRAFEELCYQLLREPADLPESGATPVRTGNPDGGVEWYVDVADGSQWGWQAKYIDDIDSLLGAMAQTVKRVVKERPNLTRLTFCIPTNLSTGTASGKRKAARQRYEDAVRSWQKDISGAGSIQFLLVQESDLLGRLAMAKHSGRRLFWFNQTYLGLDTLERLYEERAKEAGERYRPLLQIDLPIEFDLQALGFADDYFSELEKHRLAFIKNLRWVAKLGSEYGSEIAKAFEEAVASSQRLRTYLASAKFQASSVDPIAELIALTEATRQALSEVRTLVHDFDRTAARSSDGARKKLSEKLLSDSYAAGRLLNTVVELDEFLSTSASFTLRRRAYFLTGEAGSGKTHLLLDGVRKALDDQRPAVVLFGSRFGHGNLWQSIAEQLALPPVGPDDLLGALAACAEACSHQGRRFVLAIDALNDAPELSYWRQHLPAIVAAIAQWPSVALVVSCRSTYLDAVDPDNRRASDFVERAHPGFAGREVEATHTYFQHYHLPEPRIPLLLPEFTVPLFLKLYCESLEHSQALPPDHHESRVEIFTRFLQTKIDRIATSLRPNAASLERDAVKAEINTVVGLLLQECIKTGRDSIAQDRLQPIGAGFVSSLGLTWLSVVSTLESEGVLTSDVSYLDGKVTPILRITFQAFADYLILRERLGSITGDQLKSDSTLRKWLSNASYGVLEAAAVVLPELFGIELNDYLGKKRSARKRTRRKPTEGWYEDLISRTLPYRRASSISDRTVEILNSWLKNFDHGNQFFDVLFLLAPQPDHRLNGNGLHQYLNRMTMPNRDQWFGRATYHQLSDGNTAAARLARWAARGPYPSYEPTIVELASIPLVWMLGSPNRFARDWTTKALVQLLRGHPDVLFRLLERFRLVNDPYVWERLVTVAYGAVMRAVAPPAAFSPIVEFVVSRIFGDLKSFRPDALMLDSARGVVEWGNANGLIREDQAKIARPPYAIEPPIRPWTEKTIEARYRKADDKKPIEESYSSIYSSVLGYGDFGRYIVESGLHQFSRVPLNKPRPTRPQAKAESPKLNRRKWKRFIKSLNDSQVQALAAASVVPLSDDAHPTQMATLRASLSDDQRLLLADIAAPSERISIEETRYPAKEACRWIFQRVISLGWTPKRFGIFDMGLRYRDSGRSPHKPERFGKKYQWIAYHELLARVANNFHIDPYSWGPEVFDGIYELNDREIDPSLPPVPFDTFVDRTDESAGATFQTNLIPLDLAAVEAPDFRQYRHDAKSFLQDENSLPTAELLSRIGDKAGTSWIVLDGALRFFDPESDDPGEYRGYEQWTLVHGWLTPRKAAARATELLLPAAQDQRSEVLDTHGHSECCYLGELGWRPQHCYHRHLQAVELPDPNGQSIQVQIVAEDYSWGGEGFDCSIDGSVSVTTPSAFLQIHGGLKWNREQPVWLSGVETVAAFVGRHGFHEKHLLVAREDWLVQFLKSNELVLVVVVRGERRRLVGEASYREPWLEFASAVALDGHGKLGKQIARTKQSGQADVERTTRIGVLAYGSLIDDPGGELAGVTIERVEATTPFPVEFARATRGRDGGPTLVPVQQGGATVPAVVFVLDKSVSIALAKDIVYRREIHRVGDTATYSHKQGSGRDAVVVEELKDFCSCDVVLYTRLGANIEPLTADNLAELAIASAKKPAGADRRDGISYLIAAKRNRIVTDLSPEYESQVLAKTNTENLDAAWSACRKSVESSQPGDKQESPRSR